MKPILVTMTAWKRPEYTQAVVKSLKQCVGSERVTLAVAIDFDDDKQDAVVAEIAYNWPYQTHYVPAQTHKGCNANTRTALELAEYWMPELHTDWFIHIEDDTVLGPDALMLAEWMAGYGTDKELFNFSLWEAQAPYMPADPLAVHRQNDVRIWGWGTWNDRLAEILANWTPGGDYDEDDEVPHMKSWDCWMRSHVWNNRWQLAPAVSRVVNIGQEGGTHRGAEKPRHFQHKVPTGSYIIGTCSS